MRRALSAATALFITLVAACGNSLPDWNTLTMSRLRDQVPEAQIQAVDAHTLEAVVKGKAVRIDTAELQTLCNRGPKDCDHAFDQLVLQLRAAPGK